MKLSDEKSLQLEDKVKDRYSIGRRQLLTGGAFAMATIAGLGASKDSLAQQGLSPSQRSIFDSHVIDHDALENAPSFDLPFNPGIKVRGYSAINQPNCQIIIEDFFPGDEFEWQFAHDEMQYCISGQMELKVWLPPLYSDVIETTILPGTVYSYPIGARKRVKILGDEVFRHICFCPPSPNYPFPTIEQIKNESS